MGIVDALMGVLVIVVFVYFLYKKLSDKHPEIKDSFNDYNPIKKENIMEIPQLGQTGSTVY